MGKSQINLLLKSHVIQEMDLNHSAVSQAPIFFKSQIFKGQFQNKSQIFHKNQYVNRFLIEIQDSNVWCSIFQP